MPTAVSQIHAQISRAELSVVVAFVINAARNLQPSNASRCVIWLCGSIKLACHNREVGDEQIERLVASIQRRLETEMADDMVTSSQIGEMVSDSLLNLDPIAFVRFVSVYRKFSRISDFKKIIDTIPEITDETIVCKLPKTTLF